MELGLREWLIIAGVVVLLLVIGDGLRQMRRRSNRIKLKIGDGVDLKNLSEEDPTCGGELLGRVRVVDTPDAGSSQADTSVPDRDKASVAEADDGAVGFSAIDEAAERADEFGQRDTADQRTDLPMVIAVSVLAEDGQRFSGAQVLQALLAAGLQFGDMDIFHCHARENGFGPVLFSVANAVQPGTFDLDHFDDIVTPGLSLFMELHGNPDPEEALQRMLETGHYLSKMLAGRLCDERRQELTAEWTERQRNIAARAAATGVVASA